MEPTDIIGTILPYGWKGLAILLGVVLIYGIYLILNYMFKDGKCELFLSKHIEKSKSLKDLKLHPFFHNVDYLIKYKVPYLDLGDKGRTMIFRDFLRIKFEVYRDTLSNFLEQEGKCEDFCIRIDNHFDCAIKEYIDKCILEGIPQVVIDKFQQWHAPRIEFTNMAIQQLYSSSLVDNDIERMFAILTVYDGALYATMIDAENTLKKLNGDLTGLTYKNVVVGKCKY